MELFKTRANIGFMKVTKKIDPALNNFRVIYCTMYITHQISQILRFYIWPMILNEE